jgi:hypothetical protein
MNDAALISFIQNNSSGCGRFRPDQLGYELKGPRHRRSLYLSRWLLGIAIFFGWIRESAAQQKKTDTTYVVPGNKSALFEEDSSCISTPVVKKHTEKQELISNEPGQAHLVGAYASSDLGPIIRSLVRKPSGHKSILQKRK